MNNYLKGFIKQATDQGLTEVQAEQIFKSANIGDLLSSWGAGARQAAGDINDWISRNPRATTGIATGLAGAGLGSHLAKDNKGLGATLGAIGGGSAGLLGYDAYGQAAPHLTTENLHAKLNNLLGRSEATTQNVADNGLFNNLPYQAVAQDKDAIIKQLFSSQ